MRARFLTFIQFVLFKLSWIWKNSLLFWVQVSISSTFTRAFFVRNFGDKRAKKQWWNWRQVSISPTIYEQLLCMKVYCAAFFKFKFEFVIFCQNCIGVMAPRKILVKLITGWQWPMCFFCKISISKFQKYSQTRLKWTLRLLDLKNMFVIALSSL